MMTSRGTKVKPKRRRRKALERRGLVVSGIEAAPAEFPHETDREKVREAIADLVAAARTRSRRHD